MHELLWLRQNKNQSPYKVSYVYIYRGDALVHRELFTRSQTLTSLIAASKSLFALCQAIRKKEGIAFSFVIRDVVQSCIIG